MSECIEELICYRYIYICRYRYVVQKYPEKQLLPQKVAKLEKYFLFLNT